MIGLLKLLNPWYLLAGLALLAAAYFYGLSEGKDVGKQSRQSEVNDLNTRIVQMERDRLADQEAARVKVQSVNARNEALTLENLKLREQQKEKQEVVVTKWKTKIVPGTCGLSDDTTAMIRTVLSLNKEKK